MVEKRAPQTEDKYVIRFPDGMRDQLKAAAAENNRSLNAEIIKRLQTTLEMDAYAPSENVHADEVARATESGAISPDALTRRLDAQEAMLREAKDNVAVIKEWMRTLRASLDSDED